MFFSSGCTSMDYFVWGVAQLDVTKSPEKITKTPEKISDSLVHKMKEVMGSLERNTVARACNRLRPRIEEMVATGGNFSK
jgi:hypothetical protein